MKALLARVVALLRFLWSLLPHPDPAPTPQASPDYDATPAPIPDPPGPTPRTEGDAVDPMSVTWHHPFSPATFTVTATIGNVRVEGNVVTWEWLHPTTWPAYSEKAVVGNMWVIACIDGKLHGATWEWLRADTRRSKLEAKPGEPPFIQSKAYPLNAWFPKSGETFWMMASTVTRGGIPAGSPCERSPIVAAVWP